MLSSVAIREACAEDAAGIALLLEELGYPATSGQASLRLASHQLTGTIVLVAESGKRLIGLLSFHRIPLIHEDGYLGRITSLVVAEQERRRGVGQMLVRKAENHAWTYDCLRVEVTSGDHRPEAHRFYERMGYQNDCRRFIRKRPVV